MTQPEQEKTKPLSPLGPVPHYKYGPKPSLKPIDPGHKTLPALGRHVTVEYHDCSRPVLLDRDRVENAMLKAAKDSGAIVVSSSFHEFEPHGVSGVVVIAQSHFTVHAWPEHDYAAVDIFTCGDNKIFEPALDSLKTAFESRRMMVSSDLARGILDSSPTKCTDPDILEGSITIRFLDCAPVNDLVNIYKDAGWWENNSSDTGFLHGLVRDSAIFAGAFVNNQMVGMGRALSDLASDAYIQDVAVLKSHRGKGVGCKIVKALIKGLRSRGVDWIGLVAEPGTLEFYEKLGFCQMDGYTPLKLDLGILPQKED